MVVHIAADHFFRDLTDCRTEVSLRPELSSLISFVERRELFEQLGGTATFDAPHDFAGGEGRRRTDQKMHMILTHDTAENPNLEGLTGLAK